MNFEDLFDVLVNRMVIASKQKKEDILSNKRNYPLPVCRYVIGAKLMECGYPSTKVSQALGINHATLLYGRKKIIKIKAKLGWAWEVDIINNFEELCR